MTKERSGWEVFSALVIGLCLASPFNAWVTLVLWRWFAVPVGLPELRFGQVWGLVLLVSFVFNDSNAAKKSEDIWETIGSFIGTALVALTWGGIIHLVTR